MTLSSRGVGATTGVSVNSMLPPKPARTKTPINSFTGGALKNQRLVGRAGSFVLGHRSVAAINDKFILPAAFDDEQRPPARGRRVPFPPDAAIKACVVFQVSGVCGLAGRRERPSSDAD